nr:uncharacterized protein LOC120361647 [Saimiri boliviensis boliviensis]
MNMNVYEAGKPCEMVRSGTVPKSCHHEGYIGRGDEWATLPSQGSARQLRGLPDHWLLYGEPQQQGVVTAAARAESAPRGPKQPHRLGLRRWRPLCLVSGYVVESTITSVERLTGRKMTCLVCDDEFVSTIQIFLVGDIMRAKMSVGGERTSHPETERAAPAGQERVPGGAGSSPRPGHTCLGWGRSRRSRRAVVAGAGGSGWLPAAAAARPPAPVVGRRKSGTPPPHRINMHPGAGDQPSLAAPARRVPALSLRSRGERCAPGAAIARTRPRGHRRPRGFGSVSGASSRRRRLGSSLESFPSPR